MEYFWIIECGAAIAIAVFLVMAAIASVIQLSDRIHQKNQLKNKEQEALYYERMEERKREARRKENEEARRISEESSNKGPRQSVIAGNVLGLTSRDR